MTLGPSRRWAVSLFTAGLMVLGTGTISGQDYPNKPIRIVTSGIGGSSDFVARFIAQGTSGPLGQQAIVVNYASGAIPGQTAAKAPPDGYTLLVAGSTFWILPLLQDVPYDPIRDFSPITAAIAAPTVLVVHPSLPVKSVKELIALAKARPGELNYASSSAGSQTQLAAELFKYMAGVKIQGIPYVSSSVRVAELLGGQTQMTIDAASDVMPLVKAGKLRVLAVGSPQRTTLVPGLPTVSESGLPGYESISRNIVFAPAKTPEAIIKRLNQEIVRFLNLPESKARLLDIGVESAAGSPEDAAAMVTLERDRLGKMLKAGGIQRQ